MRVFLKSIAAVVGLSIFGVACGASEAPKGARSDAAGKGVAPAAASEAPLPAASDGGLCAFITAQDIASVTGKQFAAGKPQEGLCMYEDDAIGSVAVLVIRQAAKQVIDQMTMASGQRAPSLSGLADEAYLVGTTIVARKGEVMLQLSFGIYDQLERIEEVGRKLMEIGLSRL